LIIIILCNCYAFVAVNEIHQGASHVHCRDYYSRQRTK